MSRRNRTPVGREGFPEMLRSSGSGLLPENRPESETPAWCRTSVWNAVRIGTPAEYLECSLHTEETQSGCVILFKGFRRMLPLFAVRKIPDFRGVAVFFKSLLEGGDDLGGVAFGL